MNQLNPKSVWLFFFNHFLMVTLIFLFFGTPATVGTVTEIVGGEPVNGLVFPILIAELIIFWIFAYVWARLAYRYYRYELTDAAFKKELGVVWKKYVAIPYDRIQNVDIHRGLLARLLGLSDLKIQTAGASFSGFRGPGINAEGVLPGLSKEKAEQIRDELINRAKLPSRQGL